MIPEKYTIQAGTTYTIPGPVRAARILQYSNLSTWKWGAFQVEPISAFETAKSPDGRPAHYLRIAAGPAGPVVVTIATEAGELSQLEGAVTTKPGAQTVRFPLMVNVALSAAAPSAFTGPLVLQAQDSWVGGYFRGIVRDVTQSRQMRKWGLRNSLWSPIGLLPSAAGGTDPVNDTSFDMFIDTGLDGWYIQISDGLGALS